jgi:prepilin-type N-terminal cleavage/methylation domain-containing protein
MTTRDSRPLDASAQHGVTLVELMVVVALATIVAGIAVPVMLAGLEASRGAAAARYLAARMYETRFEAVKRSTFVALRFEAAGDDYTFTRIRDGNRNGVLSMDIASGIDTPIGDPTRLSHLFSGVSFALGVNPIDGMAGPDPIRLGASDLLSFNPNGSSSSGTVYLRSGNRYFAVRILGATGRTRLFQYNAATQKWQSLS